MTNPVMTVTRTWTKLRQTHLAQWTESPASIRLVAGSNPAVGTADGITYGLSLDRRTKVGSSYWTQLQNLLAALVVKWKHSRLQTGYALVRFQFGAHGGVVDMRYFG
jgi:hypothetical protein